MASSVYAELDEILELLRLAYAEIQGCLELERNCLINLQIQAIPEITGRKEDLARKVGQLEARREEIFEDMQLQFQITESPLKLRTLIPRVPAEWRESIECKTIALEKQVDLCLSEHLQNKRFLEDSLRNMSLLRENLLDHLGIGAKTYSKQGKVESLVPPQSRKRV